MIGAMTATLRDDDGYKLGMVVANAEDFGEGSKGFYGQVRLAIDGRGFLITLQAVEIRSEKTAERG